MQLFWFSNRAYCRSMRKNNVFLQDELVARLERVKIDAFLQFILFLANAHEVSFAWGQSFKEDFT
jgi:hypothetical protein